MNIATFRQAVYVLDNEAENSGIREKAIQYLKEHPNNEVIERFVNLLQDDDFGVRWEASKALSSMGRDGLIALLMALTDPKRIGDIRLRNGAYRILEHMNVPGVNYLIGNLMLALKGPAADIVTMREAHLLLHVLQQQEAMNNQTISS